MFEIARFRRLAAAQWMEGWRTWAWFLATGVLLHFLLLLGSLLTDGGAGLMTHDGQMAIYFMGLFLTGPVFAGRYFQGMAQRESAGVLLMRPASAFEKWALAVLVVAVAYPLAYSLAFMACNLPGAWVAADLAEARHAARVAEGMVSGLRGDELPVFDPEQYRLFLPWHPWVEAEGDGGMLPVVLWLTGLQAFALFGSLYFRAMPFIKTLVLGVALVIASVTLPLFFGNVGGGFEKFWDPGVSLLPLQRALYGAAWFGTPALLWLACLLALREREVA